MGKFTLSIRGPETKASPAPVPEGHAEFFGIIFKRGVFMPHWPKKNLVNEAVHVPESSKNFFRLQSKAWQFPDFENADTFVDKLMRDEMLMQDQVVDDVLRGKTQDLSLRSVQRRFLNVTGLTYKAIQQIERAHQALTMLQNGRAIVDVVYEAGYFDQPHLTRSLKRFIGPTPAQVIRSSQIA